MFPDLIAQFIGPVHEREPGDPPIMPRWFGFLVAPREGMIEPLPAGRAGKQFPNDSMVRR